jgi:hypothetical protein
LRAEAIGDVRRQFGARDRGRIDRDLVGTGEQQARASSGVRTPPPTVSGMKQTAAVRATTSSIVPRFSWLAVMSRKQSSSAPAAS